MKFVMGQLAEEIAQLCRQYAECCVEVERRTESSRLKEELVRKCTIARKRIDSSETGLLLALLDAYEVSRDEKMLQEVLDEVSANMDKLPDTVECVRLLAFCYYYVEAEECLEKAEEILEKLKRRGLGNEKIAEVEKIWEKMT